MGTSEQNPADELTRVNSRWVARLRQYSNFDWDEAPEERVVIAAVVGEGKTRDKEMIQRWQQEEQIALGEEGEMINGVYCRRHGSRRGVYLPIIPAAKVKEYVLIRHRELGHMGVGGSGGPSEKRRVSQTEISPIRFAMSSRNAMIVLVADPLPMPQDQEQRGGDILGMSYSSTASLCRVQG